MVLGGSSAPRIQHHPPAPGLCRRTGAKVSVDGGGQSQKCYSSSGNSNRGFGGWWREVFLSWGCVEVVLLHLSIRSAALKVGWACA